MSGGVVRSTLVTFACVLTSWGATAGDRPAIGARAPQVSVRDLDGAVRSPADFARARGVVLLFWAGWSERSIEQLQRLNASAKDLQARGVGIVAVNVGKHGAGAPEAAAIRQQVTRLGVQLPVLIDDRFELFHAYGVVAVPSTALIDAAGRLAYFTYGYAHGQREDLFDALDRLAGIERQRAPAPRATPAAIRRLQFGRVQLAQGRPEPARRSFEEAAQADPRFAEPLVELGALALDEGDPARARDLLNRAATIDAADRGLRRERARLQFLEGDAAAAVAAIEQLAAGKTDPLAAAYLRVLRQRGSDARATAQAMTAARREVAAGRP